MVGWGRDEEAWIVDYRILWGDPSGPRLWADLDELLGTTYPHQRGIADLGIRAVAIDTGGHHTKMAYEFCRTRLARRVWAIKGKGGAGVPVWPRRPTRSNSGKIPLFIVGVDSVKDALFARLRLTEPGPGFVHFSQDRDAEYFRQLTSERVITRYSFGRPERQWALRQEGARNESLDTLVYATAALHGLISMGLRINDENVENAHVKVDHQSAPSKPVIRSPTGVIRSSWMSR